MTDLSNKKIGLALSGGGFRATLFALGSLLRLNDAGYLRHLDTVTSVSGGAIAAGYLAYKWDKLIFIEMEDRPGYFFATNFVEEVANPLVEFCERTIDIPAFLKGFFSPFSSVGREIEKKYDDYLFLSSKLSDVAKCQHAPEFVFYGTNYDTGVSVRITKEYFRDYRVGKATGHDISLSQAVSISSSFPPFFSPVVLDGSGWKWDDSSYSDLNRFPHLRKRLVLCDGGLYDNMGIEVLWKHGESRCYDTVFVSDAGAPLQVPYQYDDSLLGRALSFINWRDSWLSQFFRMNNIMINQQRALRKRWLMSHYISGTEYDGVYWGIDVNIEKYPVDTLVDFDKQFQSMMDLPTQLRPFKGGDGKNLINWAYSLADAAIRGRYDSEVPVGKLPK